VDRLRNVRFWRPSPIGLQSFAVDDSPEMVAERLRMAFDLCEFGEAMRRAQIRREHPDLADEQVEAMVIAWLETRPGAEHGDAWGRPISWPPARP
jgi:Rv0078B-related antitoxin